MTAESELIATIREVLENDKHGCESRGQDANDIDEALAALAALAQSVPPQPQACSDDCKAWADDHRSIGNDPTGQHIETCPLFAAQPQGQSDKGAEAVEEARRISRRISVRPKREI